MTPTVKKPAPSAKDAFTTTMTPHQWFLVNDNPIQRDTERHAAKAKSRHLSGSSPAQWVVHAAVIRNSERIYKLDGHTRALLWESGELPAPEFVTVVCYPVSSMEEVETLYRTFDAITAAETSGDRISGAFRKVNFMPTSKLLKQGAITTALQTIDPARDSIYELVDEWMLELNLLDELRCNSQNDMPCGWIIAALAMFRVRGRRALPFWQKYLAGEGNMIKGERDGVRALLDLRVEYKKKGWAQKQWLMEGASKALSCGEAWLVGSTFPRALPSGRDVRQYLSSDGRSVRSILHDSRRAARAAARAAQFEKGAS